MTITTCFITKGSQAGRFKTLSGKNSYHHLEGSYLGNKPMREIGMGAQVKGIYASLFHMHRFATLPPCPYLFAVPLGKCSFFWLLECLSVLPLTSGKIHLDACTDVSHSILGPLPPPPLCSHKLNQPWHASSLFLQPGVPPGSQLLPKPSCKSTVLQKEMATSEGSSLP